LPGRTERTPERITNRIPDRIKRTERTPDRIPERINERTPGRTRTTERIPDRIPPDRPVLKTPPITPTVKLPPKNNLENLTGEQKEGTIAWKQGFFYKNWPPPYENVITTREPVEGVQYHKGADSAMASIVAKFGTIPKQLHYDMGIVDVNVFRTRDVNKPRIQFQPDKKQSTNKTGIVAKSKIISK
jgi:hypothetical protein